MFRAGWHPRCGRSWPRMSEFSSSLLQCCSGCVDSECRAYSVLVCEWSFAFQTGILGLPVTLVNSGFEPFVVVFSMTFVMQLATVLLQADNMQLAQKLLVAQRPDDGSHESDPLPQPDLHSMGRLFLPRGLALAFDASVVSAPRGWPHGPEGAPLTPPSPPPRCSW